jgi:hypothetical protein
MRRATARPQTRRMHSEYRDGLILRPLMDAGYTAWRDGRRLGVVRFVDGRVEVEAEGGAVAAVLVARLEGDLRAAGIPLPADDRLAA